MTRRALLGAFAATAVMAAPTFANAAGFLRGSGDIRRIRMYSGRTGERIEKTVHYYIMEAIGGSGYVEESVLPRIYREMPVNSIWEGAGNIMALDAKFNFDANALFRHPEIVAYRDLDEEDPAEIEASKFDLAYISLDGNIGCLVNGAGLAMATMDTIKLFGAEPANFLDVGGGATPEKVTEAFKIMLKNPKVKAILVNIFGGIMKCDTIAHGVITACKAVNLKVPLVVRMKGTNEDLGKKMLAESGLPIISADTMAQAAQKVVAALH